MRCLYPGRPFEQNEYYKVEARVKRDHTTLMEMYVVNAATLISKDLTQSGIYDEISSTFSGNAEPGPGVLDPDPGRSNTTSGTPSTLLYRFHTNILLHR